MQYRIKQINKDVFIPQCRECFLFHWKAIDNAKNFAWSNIEKYSYNRTYDEAYEVIEGYKRHLKKDKYPKYYKI